MWRMLRTPSCTASAQQLFGASLQSCSRAGLPAPLRHSLAVADSHQLAAFSHILRSLHD